MVACRVNFSLVTRGKRDGKARGLQDHFSVKLRHYFGFDGFWLEETLLSMLKGMVIDYIILHTFYAVYSKLID